MSWKNVKHHLSDQFSIRTRLTLFYSIAAFSVLTIITLFLYWESINILYRADYQFLSDEVDSIQNVLHNHNIRNIELRQAIIDIPTHPAGSIYQYYTRIYDETNHVIMETPGINQVRLPDKNIKPMIYKKSYRWFSKHHTNYLLVQSPVKLADNKIGHVQVILNISWQHTLISDREYLILVLLASAISSLFLGFYITNRGMKSLYVLTSQVENITVTSLHQRINPDELPKDLKSLGITFNQMLNRMESSFVRLKQFSSDLAHELRLPINNLIGETEIALSGNHTIDDYQQVMMSNLEEYQRISHLIENILFLSHAENPQLEIQKIMLDVRKEVSLICEYYQPMAEEKNICVQYEGHANFYGNSIMFRRMISNLLANALKYTESQGLIKFHLSADDHHTKIILTDTGIGIAKEHLPKLFDRFYRVDSARSQQSGGTGLGLAIVKSIVDLHRGNISIRSEINVGTAITMLFPVAIHHE